MTSRVFLVSFTTEIPVVADSEEEAREYLLDEDCDVIERAVVQIKSNMMEDDDENMTIEEITEESLDEKYAEYANLVPWGDDGDDTIAERLHSDYVEDDEGNVWSEPSHVDD